MSLGSLETELLRQAAELAAERGDWTAATRHYQELTETEPEDIDGLLALAQALRRTGRAAEAERTERRAELLVSAAAATAKAPPPEPVPEAPPPEPPQDQDELATLLLAEAAAWTATPDAEGIPRQPAGLRQPGPLASLPPLLTGYLQPDCRAAIVALPPGLPWRAEAEGRLQREAALRGLARGEEAREDAARALLPDLTDPAPDLPAAAARATARGYFSPEAAWLRYRLRRALGTGQALPAPASLPLPLLRLEPDLIRALAGADDIATLLTLPLVLEDGALFYRLTDTCLRQSLAQPGIALARMGEAYFQRRGQTFKSLEFALKGGALHEQVNDHPGALACYHRAIAGADNDRMLLAGLRGAMSVIPPRQQADGAEVVALRHLLVARGEAALTAALTRLLGQTGGSGDPLQQRATQALTTALAEAGTGAILIPPVALGSPTLFGHMLRHGAATHPGRASLAPAVRQISAFGSGFTDLVASGQHLADLLRAGDHEGIAAIGAYITRRYGAALMRPDRPGVTTVLGSGNVGDTLLYMAGFAAFTRASGQPVHVLHRASRTALTEFFGAIPGLSFEAIPNDLELPTPLKLNRLSPGSVSLFYETPWYRQQELRRLDRPGRADGFLWDKLVSVMLSGATMLPEQIVVERPPVAPPEQWNQEARARFAALRLRRGRTVFLSPLANTLFSLTASRFNHFRAFWREAIGLFRAAGFTVAINGTNNNKAEALFADLGVPELELDLRELPGFVRECGYFAGVRSGLCDLLALCGPEGVESRTVYMRDAEHCIGLMEFGMAEAVADFQAHAPRALAESLFADWLATRP
ncbi:hypothetical protein [Roseomonas marmotae]|uniref:Tetratricopeptide repeat protein n=1 Tax=Roseomonas marmotae TaxID=2768161 RepID=A0ABS3K6F8_9PROT|nr:hypothetical protein [Roseomonas marmotae]MBO1073029.1 hypothetical protein [Roseomonas marmotae]QTI79324.1 hypothetical protein IAI58_00335 [Roseomonas marmotae]